jgi:uncharacterized membrane protein (UPF0127 family)
MACSFQARCTGLLRRSILAEQEGLLLVPGGSIHTLGMRCTIDVVFLNRQMRVLGLAERVPPWRIRVAPRGTRRVLEIAAGQVAATRLTVGTYLVVDEAPAEPNDKSTCPTVNLRGARREACERLPIQFSLRLPIEHRCTAPISAKCSAGARAKVATEQGREPGDPGAFKAPHFDPHERGSPAAMRPTAGT